MTASSPAPTVKTAYKAAIIALKHISWIKSLLEAVVLLFYYEIRKIKTLLIKNLFNV